MRGIIRTSSFKNGFAVYDRFFVCFFIVFCVGLIIGALFAGMSGYGSDSTIFKIWQQNFTLLKEKSVFSVFVHSIAPVITYLLVIYSLGVCAVGSVFLAVPCLVLGVGKGIFFGFLCLEGGILQYAWALIFVLLQNIVFCTVILLLLSLSLKMSIQTFSQFANLSFANSLPLSFKKYNQWYLISLCTLALNSVLDAVLMRFY